MSTTPHGRTGTDKKLTVAQLQQGMTALGMPGNPLNPAGFSDSFAGIPAGSLPSAQNWAIANGGPADDPTLGSQWYEDDVQNVFVDSSGYLNMVVTVNGGGTTTTQAYGNYIAPRISTFAERSGPINPGGGAAAQGGKPWSMTRPGFTGFQMTYGTFSVTAKLFTANGFWPALWLCGVSHWPGCGEIDLYENFGGNGLGTLALGYGNVIGPANPSAYSAYNWQVGTACHTPANINDGAFHTYKAVIPSDYSSVSMYMDGTSYVGFPCSKSAWLAQASAAGHSSAIWPFGPTNYMGIVANVCVGSPGTPPPTGYPASGQTFPFTSMQISNVSVTIP